MRLTDMADELYTAATDLPGGVRAAMAKRGGVTVTRVEIAREGLEKPRGRYVTLEVPSVSVLDERDAEVIEQAADELRALLPPEGPVLVSRLERSADKLEVLYQQGRSVCTRRLEELKRYLGA